MSLSLPLIDQIYTGDVVYNFFDNLLPDNPQIRAGIQARFQIPTNQPFDLLTDCVGAIHKYLRTTDRTEGRLYITQLPN